MIENGSGLSRRERITAGGLAGLLVGGDAQPGARRVRELAGGRRDRRHRWSGASRTDGVAGQALLKTGTLEGVRALAGYVIDAEADASSSSRSSTTPDAAPRRARARPPGAVGLPTTARSFDPALRR